MLGPILTHAYGAYAPLVMLGLCVVAYLFGEAIRFNIADLERETPRRGAIGERLETAASWSLAFAYVVSVAYHLNLFGAFGVRLTPAAGAVNAKLLTTAMFLLILAVGWARGFKALERLEYVSVTIKLAVIAALLLGLAVYFQEQAAHDALRLDPSQRHGWRAATLGFGLLITVQGFEAARYLGQHYDARERIASMRLAQWLSAVIYLGYVGLLAYAFDAEGLALNETAIIDLMRLVAPALPALLVLGALAAQFSAAVADTSGSGDLIVGLTGQRVRTRHAYAVLVGAGLALTWFADVFDLIVYASRAFAVYYALQSLIAGVAAWREPRRRPLAVLFGALTLLGVAIVVFGEAVEA